MTSEKLKNKYYDLVDSQNDSNENIKELLINAGANSIEEKPNGIYFMLNGDKFLIHTGMKIFATVQK
jgi:hypothetical protein